MDCATDTVWFCFFRDSWLYLGECSDGSLRCKYVWQVL